MTEPTSPQPSPTPLSDKPRLRRIAAWGFGCMLVFSVVMLTTAAWLSMSNAGANFSLSMLERFAGIKSTGVSGSLARRLHVQHIEILDQQMELSADDVDLQWQPKALLQGRLQLDYLRVKNLDLALGAGDGKPITLPKSLQLTGSIRSINADQLEVSRLELSTLTANHRHEHPQDFSDLRGKLSIDSRAYVAQLSGLTPWGNAALKGQLASSAPFKIDAQIDWHGLPIQQKQLTVPKSTLSGTVGGDLSKLLVDASLIMAESQVDPSSAKKSPESSGTIHAALTPFAKLPVDTIQINLVSVNPASFYKDAPQADLQVNADFKATGNINAPVLSGHFFIKNSNPRAWNSGGIPVVQLSSDLTASEQQISWKSARIELEQGGYAAGDGAFKMASAAQKDVVLPDLNAQFEVSKINLLLIDSRLKKTQLSGKIQVQNKRQDLNFALNLQELDPKLPGKVNATLILDKQLTIQLQKMELSSKDATLTAIGSYALFGNQEFALTGEAHNFNPARWIDVPEGHIATHFKLAGQLQHGWQFAAQIAELSGRFAGLDLQGESDFSARQDQLLAIKKLDISWGKNHLSAKGNWQLEQHLNPRLHEQLRLTLAVPDLAALSHPFEKILPLKLKGSLLADGILTGNAAQPAGHLTIKANQLAIPDVIYLDNMQADVALEEGAKGQIVGTMTMAGLSTSAPTTIENSNLRIERLDARLSGLRHAHNLQVNVAMPQQQQISLQVMGDLQKADARSEVHWLAQVQALNLSGPLDFKLQAPFRLNVSASSAQMSEADWQGRLGRLHVQQVNWTHGQISTTGRFQDIPAVRVLKLWRTDLPITGKLLLDASWQVEIGDRVAGQVQIQRTSGDITFQDITSGQPQLVALGLQNLLVKASVGDDRINSHQASQAIKISVHAQGDQLGLIDANLSTSLRQSGQGWALPHNAPLSGQATAQAKDIRWMSPLLGPDVNIHGELNAEAQLNGTLDNPDYQARILGSNLQIAFSSLGIMLPNGNLDARIEDHQFKLSTLKFSQTIKKPPRHEDLNDLTWLAETGYVESSGVVDLKTLKGSINTTWQKFPFLQNRESWLVGSGEAQLVESEKTWNLTGKFLTDGAYFSVPKQASPRLSSDVVVLKKNDKRSREKTGGLQTSLDFSINTGKNFIFVGRGLDTRLDGEIRMRSRNGGALLATGSIQTAGGTYEGYGQKLAIDRGILNFQGPIDNPGLNVRAIRRGLQVEAGVEVIGTVAKPEVHLISEPNVPDSDKLSWMVLGRGTDQMAGSETSLLMSAAGAIFGGEGGSNIPDSIAHTLGLNGLTFGTTSAAPGTQLPNQTVAGTINNGASPDQVFSVGTRVAPNLVFSIERSLTDASNGLKLTWQLTRRFSIIGRAGTDTAIDGQYIFSFD